MEYMPTRKTLMHTWHEKNNAFLLMLELGKDPDTINKEMKIYLKLQKRGKKCGNHIGICDVTTLGKIDIKGPDAAEFLNRVYTNAWLKPCW